MASRDYSIIEYYAEHEGYRCGYCKSTDTNYSHGLWAHTMTVQDYQDIIDRGWRRSGRYCYKPTMHVTCCPMYTIKCEALEFKISKSQKKVIKRFNRFLAHGLSKSNDDALSLEGSEASDDQIQDGGEMMDVPNFPKKSDQAKKHKEDAKVLSVDPSLSGRIEPEGSDLSYPEPPGKHKLELSMEKSGDSSETSTDSKKDANLPKKVCLGPDGARPPMKKAKLMRLERKQEKLMKKGFSKEEAERMLKEKKQPPPQGKSLEELLNEPLPEDPAHRLEVRLVRSTPPSREYEQTSEQAHEVFRKYQMAVHREPADKCTLHHYKRFLVTSPLKPWKPVDGPPHGYGSFHQQYWLDGRLIAVAVIDILPYCVSSVYFYYDPEFGHLSLGTYASLREIALVRSLHTHSSALKYYYMGFYIHTCPKMRYKARYNPSFLLCPETYTWHPIEQCQRKLDVSRYSRFEENSSVLDEDGQININEILILFHKQAMPYFIYRTLNRNTDDSEEVMQYARLVGMKCARRMLLVRV
ncbi:arginyl-tRNA--protein transferase 1 isoform X1 [Schistocerca nitens]|uniref:arginyl-tRNA--protein transferase 1 isoform X1 n=1 Tax=Schistocerca nitens TaxID=7011 RepID=UPI0021183EFA|nr:arginyl-tRNA--protein transferase 1 isoform X1 [Schistocerca nitens]